MRFRSLFGSFSQVYLFSIFNRFLILSTNFYFFICFRFFLQEYFVMKGFYDVFADFSFDLFSSSLNLLDFSFIKVNDSIIYSIFSQDFLRVYKLKLKLLVKNCGFNSNIFLFLKLLNRVIFVWSVNYNFLNCFYDIWSAIDVYLYKLLWRWARRRHPRRPNTWIYAKYWRIFSGVYKFYTINYLTGNFLILRSHYYLHNFISRLPIALNFYNNFDEKKFNFFAFMRFKQHFNGLFGYFWFKQKGLCFVCKKSFDISNFNGIKFQTNTVLTNNIYNYYLVHAYCC